MSNGDPVGSELPKGKSNAKRMGRYDGSFTPSEQRTKNRLMRQFMKTGEGPGGNSEAYRNAECWCACGRLKAEGRDECAKCLRMDAGAPETDLNTTLRRLDPTISSGPIINLNDYRPASEGWDESPSDPSTDMQRAFDILKRGG